MDTGFAIVFDNIARHLPRNTVADYLGCTSGSTPSSSFQDRLAQPMPLYKARLTSPTSLSNCPPRRGGGFANAATWNFLQP